MACLGEASRFRLVQALMGGARCVTDLASEVGLSQSCTTRHLQALESRRVVSARREGKRVLYRIRDDDPGLLPLLEWALVQPSGGAGSRPRRVRLRASTVPGSPELEPGHKPEPRPEPGPAAVIVEPRLEPAPPSVRRNGGSEIEDYLL